ncbi:hypothetical protein AB1L30_09820 [Bremerella sp. JC817]|uniref:hypothetical protein n=1 Tax=Bremerella sp. JC817 TaxID=3231756 RepID=UPI003458F72E
MNHRTVCLWSVGVLSATLALTGCGPSGPEMGDVSGKVTYRGKPLPTGTITFIPETEGMPRAFAEINSDGTYVAETKPFGRGVPLGKHRVMISAVIDHGPNQQVEPILPPKFSSDRQSGLTADVVPGENIFDFSL